MRVVVLGAGYAGLTVARALERSLPEEVELVVVNDSPDHLVQHELHRLIRHPDLAEAITVPLSTVLSRVTVHEGTVTAVDTEQRALTYETEDGETSLEYDFAAICLGAVTDFYGLDQIEEHAITLKSITDATRIRKAALDATDGHAVVGGAGLSGIQVAGELAELSTENELNLDVTLVEMADQIAPEFDATMAAAIRRELESRGVSIETGVGIEAADNGAVYLEGDETLPADLFVWTGGIRGPDALDGTRPRPEPDLRVSDHTFVVGDAGDIVDANGRDVPATAQAATQQAQVVAANIQRLVEDTDEFSEEGDRISIPVEDADGDEDPERPGAFEESGIDQYELDLAGWVVSVGDGAVAMVGPFVFSGEPAKATKAAIVGQHLGSVGAIQQASTLVAEELGWPTTDVFGIAAHLDATDQESIPLQPGSAAGKMTDVARIAAGLSETLTMGETIDLTPFTRQADRNYPNSPVHTAQRLVTDSVGMVFGDCASSDDDETTKIDVEDSESEDEAGRADEAEKGDEAEMDDETESGDEAGRANEAETNDDAETDDNV